MDKIEKSGSIEQKVDNWVERSITDAVCGDVGILKGGIRTCKKETKKACLYKIAKMQYGSGLVCDANDYENAINKTARIDLSGYDMAERANPQNRFVDPEAKNKNVWVKGG